MSRWGFKDDDLQYLEGAKFSNGRTFKGQKSVAQLRTDVLVEAARGRRVLHVGFADHLPLIEQKRQRGEWIHDRITQVAEKAVGVDIDEGVVATLRAMGVRDVYAADLTAELEEPDLLGETFDVVILGEVLEHVGNPVAFLRAIRDNVGSPGQSIVVTVPNAWNIAALVSALRGAELVNTDHRFWFTPYTLAKVLTDAGYQVDHVDTCLGAVAPSTLRGRVGTAATRRFGLLRAHVVGFAHQVD